MYVVLYYTLFDHIMCSSCEFIIKSGFQVFFFPSKGNTTKRGFFLFSFAQYVIIGISNIYKNDAIIE